jgi:hypothetical protein
MPDLIKLLSRSNNKRLLPPLKVPLALRVVQRAKKKIK